MRNSIYLSSNFEIPDGLTRSSNTFLDEDDDDEDKLRLDVFWDMFGFIII